MKKPYAAPTMHTVQEKPALLVLAVKYVDEFLWAFRLAAGEDP